MRIELKKFPFDFNLFKLQNQKMFKLGIVSLLF